VLQRKRKLIYGREQQLQDAIFSHPRVKPTLCYDRLQWNPRVSTGHEHISPIESSVFCSQMQPFTNDALDRGLKVRRVSSCVDLASARVQTVSQMQSASCPKASLSFKIRMITEHLTSLPYLDRLTKLGGQGELAVCGSRKVATTLRSAERAPNSDRVDGRLTRSVGACNSGSQSEKRI
jgi:hypothetical protein